MSADTRFRCWSAAGQRMECALSVLEQLNSAARDGFRRFRHGGMEVGGLLTGLRTSHAVRVMAAQPVEIAYRRGAVFLLTDDEHAAFKALVAKTNKDLESQGLQVVGYYESRTRRDAVLSDAETFDAHFSLPSQVCIVLKPNRENETITAVYVRGERGEILAADLEGDTVEQERRAVTAAPRPPQAQPPAMLPKRPASRRIYVIVAIVLVALASAAAMLWAPGERPAAPSTSLQPPPAPPPASPQGASAAPEPAVKPSSKNKRGKRSRRRRIQSRKQER